MSTHIPATFDHNWENVNIPHDKIEKLINEANSSKKTIHVKTVTGEIFAGMVNYHNVKSKEFQIKNVNCVDEHMISYHDVSAIKP